MLNKLLAAASYLPFHYEAFIISSNPLSHITLVKPLVKPLLQTLSPEVLLKTYLDNLVVAGAYGTKTAELLKVGY